LEDFEPVHDRIIETLRGEGIIFDEEHIDFSLPADDCPGRKPGTGMLSSYLDGSWNLEHSVVIGDRLTDVELAKNIGCKAVWLAPKSDEAKLPGDLRDTCILVSDRWGEIASFLLDEPHLAPRTAEVTRTTRETTITLSLSLDGGGLGKIHTRIPFFDHMLDQIRRHSGCDLSLHADGDLMIDEHHTVEDVGIALGEAFRIALGEKRGINRYGFEVLTMDEVKAEVALDFSNRPAFVYDVPIAREYIGIFPTEMVEHFFKSFSDSARCNLHMKVSTGNAHHQVEGLFKAFARAVRQAIHRNPYSDELPSTKGVL
jgi:imidazoleglycerol-phosphate dehydratase/histidinol-phosphatase